MDIEFDEDGGHAVVATGRDASTTLRVFRDHDTIHIDLDATWRNSEMSLGVGLDADQARRVGEYLIGLSEEIEGEEE